MSWLLHLDVVNVPRLRLASRSLESHPILSLLDRPVSSLASLLRVSCALQVLDEYVEIGKLERLRLHT